MKRVRLSSDPGLTVLIDEERVEEISQEAEKRNMSRNALLRRWVAIGERVDKDLMPEEVGTHSGTIKSERNPVEELFVEHLPDEEEDAITIDELRDSVKKSVDSRIQKVFREYENIEFADSGGIYRDA